MLVYINYIDDIKQNEDGDLKICDGERIGAGVIILKGVNVVAKYHRCG